MKYTITIFFQRITPLLNKESNQYLSKINENFEDDVAVNDPVFNDNILVHDILMDDTPDDDTLDDNCIHHDGDYN
ncbi:unnamed protein product [Rotaria sordida]|uniref:Uncharacterized protein n=2 Tax=Rotaria sordida TaxID=392033 RepID=A0A820FXI6_9BILA|nr:unnamed protein product [Rotaria sordida]